MKKLFALGLLLATSLAFAVPTQFGYSGGFTVPNAQIEQGVSLDVLIDTTEDFSVLFGPGILSTSDKLPKMQLTFGLGKSLEMCIGYHSRDYTFDTGGGPLVLEFATTNASLKYGLPYTFLNGKFAIGAQFDTTSSDMGGSIDRWVGLLTGTFPAFNENTTFTTALMFVTGDTDERTALGVALERKLSNNGVVGVEYIINSPNDYIPTEGDFGTIYVALPFGDMFTGRLALTGINETAKLAYSLNAKF
ncbi:MAG: hypothetical protein ACYC7E_14065 [Armatimonadota bacterium]